MDFDDFKRVFIDLLKLDSWRDQAEINGHFSSERLAHDLTSTASSVRLKADSDKKTTAIPAVDQLSYCSTIRYLRSMFRSLNVGEDGFLDLHDLRSVCQGIGMVNASDEVVNQLFVSLDQDMDGRVSFEELLHAILRHLGMQKVLRQPSRRDQRSARLCPSNASDVLLNIRKSVSSTDIASSQWKRDAGIGVREGDGSDDDRLDSQSGRLDRRMHRRLMERKKDRQLDDQAAPCPASGLITGPSLETSSISPSSVFPDAICSSQRHTIPSFLSSDFFHLRRAFSDADILWSQDLS